MYSLFDQALEKKEELSDLRKERRTTLDNFCLDEHGDRKSPGFKDLKRELKLYAKLMDKVQAAQEKAIQKLHKAQEEEKQIRKRMAELTRNERTHRLCTRGGYLEKLLIEPELFTDEDVFAFLDYALNTPFVQTRLNSMLETKRKAAAKTEETEAGESIN